MMTIMIHQILVLLAKKAKSKGIIINTIQCGNMPNTDRYWKAIAQFGGGEYFHISGDGGVKVVTNSL